MKTTLAGTSLLALLLCAAVAVDAQDSSDDPVSRVLSGSTKGIQATTVNAAPDRRLRIGITTRTLDDLVASHLGLEAGEAFVIASVTDGMPAAKAGLKVHDVITHLEGEKPATVERLREILRGKSPGNSLSVQGIREGETFAVTLALRDDISDVVRSFKEALDIGGGSRGRSRGTGATAGSGGGAGARAVTGSGAAAAGGGSGHDPTTYRQAAEIYARSADSLKALALAGLRDLSEKDDTGSAAEKYRKMAAAWAALEGSASPEAANDLAQAYSRLLAAQNLLAGQAAAGGSGKRVADEAISSAVTAYERALRSLYRSQAPSRGNEWRYLFVPEGRGGAGVVSGGVTVQGARAGVTARGLTQGGATVGGGSGASAGAGTSAIERRLASIEKRLERIEKLLREQ